MRQLAADTLVSVITVKQAYQALEAAGLIRSHQGRGTFVAEAGADAARAELERDIGAALDATVARAAALGLARATVVAAVEQSLTTHFPETKA